MQMLGLPQDRETYGVNFYINQKENSLIIELCLKEADALYKYYVRVGSSIRTINNNLNSLQRASLKHGPYNVKELYADALNSKYYVEIPLTTEDVK